LFVTDDVQHSGADHIGWRMTAKERRQELQRTLARLSESSAHMPDAKRVIAAYCRDLHQDGADPATVLIEIKRLAKPILDEDDGRLQRLISDCIRHYYGDVEIPL
jgi:hypothetical protein